eukprot:318073-Hanusia_phi.AAC.1
MKSKSFSPLPASLLSSFPSSSACRGRGPGTPPRYPTSWKIAGWLKSAIPEAVQLEAEAGSGGANGEPKPGKSAKPPLANT